MPDHQPYIVGITGGIGAGKTIVTKVFATLGIPCYNSDLSARDIVNRDILVKELIIEHFGDIYREGKLDRKKLGSIVFNDKEKLQTLNSIVHPAVKKDFGNWCALQATPYILKEAAIMIESKSHLLLDKLILVTAPKSLRIKRVIKRDSVSKEVVESRIQNQLSDEEKRSFSDFEIVNDEEIMLLTQILSVHNNLLTYAS